MPAQYGEEVIAVMKKPRARPNHTPDSSMAVQYEATDAGPQKNAGLIARVTPKKEYTAHIPRQRWFVMAPMATKARGGGVGG
jgi:hypothetical protein